VSSLQASKLVPVHKDDDDEPASPSAAAQARPVAPSSPTASLPSGSDQKTPEPDVEVQVRSPYAPISYKLSSDTEHVSVFMIDVSSASFCRYLLSITSKHRWALLPAACCSDAPQAKRASGTRSPGSVSMYGSMRL